MQNRAKLKLFFISAFFALCSNVASNAVAAEDSVPLQVSWLQGAGEIFKLSWPYQTSWVWRKSTAPSGAFELYLKVLISTPDELKIRLPLDGGASDAKISIIKDESEGRTYLQILTQSPLVSGKIEIESEKGDYVSRVLTVRAVPEVTTFLVAESCRKAGISVRSYPSTGVFLFAGLSCIDDAEDVTHVYPSHSDDVENIPEKALDFPIPDSVQDGSIVGDFTLKNLLSSQFTEIQIDYNSQNDLRKKQTSNQNPAQKIAKLAIPPESAHDTRIQPYVGMIFLSSDSSGLSDPKNLFQLGLSYEKSSREIFSKTRLEGLVLAEFGPQSFYGEVRGGARVDLVKGDFNLEAFAHARILSLRAFGNPYSLGSVIAPEFGVYPSFPSKHLSFAAAYTPVGQILGGDESGFRSFRITARFQHLGLSYERFVYQNSTSLGGSSMNADSLLASWVFDL